MEHHDIFLQFLWHNAEKLSSILIAAVTTAAFIVAVIEYRRQKKNHEEQNRPYVIVDLERVVSGLFDISVRNIGKSVAQNIKVTFKPNIKPYNSDLKINDLNFLKNLRFLPPDKDLRFFFGSVMGETVIKREFKVQVKYEDVAGEAYAGSFVIDPRDFLELHSISRYDMHDAVKKLEDIAKFMKNSARAQENVGNILGKEGLKIRNQHTDNMSAAEILRLVVGLYDEGTEYELTLRPFIYDAKLLIKQARDKILPAKDNDGKAIIKELNWLLEKEWSYQPEEASKHFEALKKLLIE